MSSKTCDGDEELQGFCGYDEDDLKEMYCDNDFPSPFGKYVYICSVPGIINQYTFSGEYIKSYQQETHYIFELHKLIPKTFKIINCYKKDLRKVLEWLNVEFPDYKTIPKN